MPEVLERDEDLTRTDSPLTTQLESVAQTGPDARERHLPPVLHALAEPSVGQLDLGRFDSSELEVDERTARQALRRQIGRLESELASLFCSTYPRQGFEWSASRSRGGPRMLTTTELERTQDELAERLEENRRQLSDRTRIEDQKRCRIEEMMLDPAAHKWEIVSNEDLGEPGCKHWHVRPRWGLLGMLLNWWRVRISSGCPLAEGRGPRP